MKDFSFYAPTQVVFGAKSEEKIPQLIKRYGGTKVLIHYGGKSAEKSGLLPEIKQRLTDAGIPFLTLGGVVPNPRLSKAKEGIELCRKEGIDFAAKVLSTDGRILLNKKTLPFSFSFRTPEG